MIKLHPLKHQRILNTCRLNEIVEETFCFVCTESGCVILPLYTIVYMYICIQLYIPQSHSIVPSFHTSYHIYKITNVRPSVTERLQVISGNNSNLSLYSAILKAERLGPAPARALGLLLQ